MRRFKQLLVTSVLLLSMAFVPTAVLVNTVQAQSPPQNPNCTKSSDAFLGFPTWYKYLDFEEGSADCDINFDITKDIGKVLLAIFEILLRIAGLVAVGFVIFGGFQYLISQGEPEQTKGARSTILNAVIGLAIAISATAIVNLIARNIV